MYKGTHEELNKMLHTVAKTNGKIAMMIHGSTAIGKTQTVYAFAQQRAKELKLRFSKDIKDINDEKVFYCCVLPLHLFDLAEIKGLPFPNDERTMTTFLQQGLLPNKGQGIIFYDEINLALPSVLNNAYQLILEKCIGEYKIPAGFQQIAAGNLISDRANINEMPFPLRTRMIHFLLNSPIMVDRENPQNPSWYKWAIEHNINQYVINFVLQSGSLNKYSPTIEDDEFAIATPRTWEFASDLLAEIDMKDYDAVEMAISAATSLGKEFVGWLKISQSYDILKIFKTGKVEPVPKEIDQIYALISAVIGHYRDHNKKEDSVKVLHISKCLAKEHMMMLISQLNSYDTSFIDKLQELLPEKEYDAVCESMLKFVLPS